MKLSEDAQRTITVFISTVLIFSAFAYIIVSPRPQEQFLQLYVLGEDKMAEHYYPNDNSTIPVDLMVKWYIGVSNHMGSVRYVVIKTKIGNATSQSPDESRHTPAPLPVLMEFGRVMLGNETWEFPFTWKITTLERLNNLTYASLNINGVDIRVSDIGVKQGEDFRLIFELWTLDINSGEVTFGWLAEEERRVSWTQIWFNSTL